MDDSNNVTVLIERNQRLLARIVELEGQLPKGMEDYTIVFRQCDVGHGWLSTTRWLDHGCPICERKAIEARANKFQEANEKFAAIVEQTNKRIVALTELATRADALAVDAHVRWAQARTRIATLEQELREAHMAAGRPATATVPLHHDEHGPLYKDDLDADALRDGYLKRSRPSLTRVEAAVHRARTRLADDPEHVATAHADTVHSPPPPTTVNPDCINDKLAAEAQANMRPFSKDDPDTWTDPISHDQPLADATGEAGPHVAYDTPTVGKRVIQERVREPTAFEDYVDSLPSTETSNTPDKSTEDR